MKNLINSILGLSLMLILSSCNYTTGQGPVVERGFALDAFQGVEMEGSFNVNIKQGTQQNVVVAGNENIIDKLKMEVMDGVLYLSLEPGSYFNYELEVNLTMPTVSRVVLSGSADIEVGTFVGLGDLDVFLEGSGDIESDGVLEVKGVANIELDGSGDIDLMMKADEVNAELDGSGDIDLAGTTNKLKVSLDGSGDISAYKLESLNCEATLEGSGNIRVFASKNLEANLEGSGDINYKGEPNVTAKIDGSGSIEAN